MSKEISKGNLAAAEATLANQAVLLNGMFGEFSRRAIASIKPDAPFERIERWLKMAMKAQNQCRMTLETLANVKNPPVVYARQANITNGPQQVNNGVAAPRAREENKNSQTKILEEGSEPRMDTGAQSQGLDGNSSLATVEAGHRSENA